MTTCAQCGATGEAYAPCPRCGELVEPAVALEVDGSARAWDAGTSDAPTAAQIGGSGGAAPIATADVGPPRSSVRREIVEDAERAIARDDERRRKLWWRAVHAPAWAVLAFFTLSYLALDSRHLVVNDMNDLVHIGGHALFNWGGDAQRALGGTIGQMLASIGLAAYFFIGRADRFWGVAAAWWAGQNLTHIAAYVRDAEATLREPLAGDTHAWAFLLDRWDATERAASIAGTIDTAGIVAMSIALAALAFLAWFPDRQELVA